MPRNTNSPGWSPRDAKRERERENPKHISFSLSTGSPTCHSSSEPQQSEEGGSSGWIFLPPLTLRAQPPFPPRGISLRTNFSVWAVESQPVNTEYKVLRQIPGAEAQKGFYLQRSHWCFQKSSLPPPFLTLTSFIPPGMKK